MWRQDLLLHSTAFHPLMMMMMTMMMMIIIIIIFMMVMMMIFSSLSEVDQVAGLEHITTLAIYQISTIHVYSSECANKKVSKQIDLWLIIE